MAEVSAVSTIHPCGQLWTRVAANGGCVTTTRRAPTAWYRRPLSHCRRCRMWCPRSGRPRVSLSTTSETGFGICR
eukprot:3503018-Prymnesium_polylepis.1